MAEPSESPIAPPDVTGVTAPLLFGLLFNWALYGALCVQIYIYSYNFSKDGRFIKFLAYFVFLVETVQTSLTGADIYYWFVTGYGNVERLGNSHFSPIDIPIPTTVVSFIVQGYFCYQIWVLNNRSSWICWIIAVASVTQSVAAMWASIKSLMVGKYIVSKTLLYLWAIPSALADILIAVAMTLLLRRAIGKFSSFVLHRVVRLTIETNILTATFAIAALVLYVAYPNELYYAYPAEVIGKVYSNTLLASLNNRIYLRDRQSPEYGDIAWPPVSDGVRTTAMTSLSFATPEPQSQALSNNIFISSVISRSVDLDNSRGDGARTD